MFALYFSLAPLECELVGGAQGGILQVNLLLRHLFDVEPFGGHGLELVGKSVVTRLLIVIALFQRHARLHLGKIESIGKKLSRDLREALGIRAHRTLQAEIALTRSLRGDGRQTLRLYWMQYLGSSLCALMGPLAAVGEDVEIVALRQLLGAHILVIVNGGGDALCIFERFQLLGLKCLTTHLLQDRLAPLSALANVLGVYVLNFDYLRVFSFLKGLHLFFIININDVLVLGRSR